MGGGGGGAGPWGFFVVHFVGALLVLSLLFCVFCSCFVRFFVIFVVVLALLCSICFLCECVFLFVRFCRFFRSIVFCFRLVAIVGPWSLIARRDQTNVCLTLFCVPLSTMYTVPCACWCLFVPFFIFIWSRLALA